MRDLPVPIREFILSLTDEKLSPAYLLTTQEGKLVRWGGELESYGVEGLKEDLDISEHIPFLAGLFPFNTNNMFLPQVETREGVAADIYLFTRDQDVWVLFLDATADRTVRQKMQQKLYDSRLRVSDLEREGDALYKANVVLEEIVRERTADLWQTILQLRQQLAERERVRKAQSGK
jgi:hypothetical protein